jgi:hypothetical protein
MHLEFSSPKKVDDEFAGAKGMQPQTVTPPINLSGNTGATFNIIFNNAENVTLNGPFPSPTSPNCNQAVNSNALMSGGVMTIQTNFQSGEKRQMSYPEKQNKKMAACNNMNNEEIPMETDGPASGGLPDFGSAFLHRNAVMKGQLNPMKTEPVVPSPVDPMQRGKGRSLSDTGPNRDVQRHVKSPGVPDSNVPPTRTQSVSVTEHSFGDVAPMEHNGAAADDEKNRTWPKAAARGPVLANIQSASEPWNMQYSEFRRG